MSNSKNRNPKGLKTSIYDTSTPGATAGWVMRDPTPDEVPELMEHIIGELATERGFLHLALRNDVMAANSPTGRFEWDEYQLQLFACSRWLITNKCRQSGLSFALAAKAFARGLLTEANYSFIFTSYKKEEAINKIEYVKQFLQALAPKFKKRILRDPLQLLEFENHNGTKCRIMSHAQKPIRGINGDIGLDELAFYQNPEEIYTSALPAVGAVRGAIFAISTPFGKDGIFYEVFSDHRKYSQYDRLPVYWWFCKRYLKHESLEFYLDATRNAHRMSTEERIERYGNDFIKMQFENSFDIESFQQEFEGYFVDAQAAFFTKDTITNAMYFDRQRPDDFDPSGRDLSAEYGQVREGTTIEKIYDHEPSKIEMLWGDRKDASGNDITFGMYDSMEELRAAINRNEITANLYAGYDIGTTRHSSVLTIVEEIYLPDGNTLQIERFSHVADNNKSTWLLEDQQLMLERWMHSGLIRRMVADCTGIGMQMGQSLKRKFQGMFVDLQMGGNNSKQEMFMTNLKARMEHLHLAIRYDKRSLEDIYKIQRVVGANKSVRFEADEKRRHHADKAWSLAFASMAGTPFNVGSASFIGAQTGANVRADSVFQRDYENRKSLENGTGRNTLRQRPMVSSISSRDARRFIDSSASRPGGFINNYEE